MILATKGSRGDLPPIEFVQICYVVEDLRAACTRIHELTGVGPFIGGTDAELSNHIYRGKPKSPIHLRGVFVQSGNLNIELVEVISNAPSAFHDMYPNGTGGIHHMAQFCNDYISEKKAFIDAGCPIVSEFSIAEGVNICYVDARDTVGCMIELYPDDPLIRDMYRQAREAPLNWDGQELIIPWGVF